MAKWQKQGMTYRGRELGAIEHALELVQHQLLLL
jgi:hypothetical protein